MRSSVLAKFCFIAAGAVHAETYTIPAIGFAQNIGQYDADILFGRDDNYFRASNVQVSSDLSIGLAGALPTVRVVGEDALPHALHFYLGPDSTRWRENVPHFSRVRYAGVYAGIDAEWRFEGLRLSVTPGANLGQIILRLQSTTPMQWSISSSGDWISAREAYGFTRLAATESGPDSSRALTARFVQAGESSFRLDVSDWDGNRPLTITMSIPQWESGTVAEVVKAGYDGSAFVAGRGWQAAVGVLAKSSPGKPEFVSLIPTSSQQLLSVERDGSTTVAGWVTGGGGVPPGELQMPASLAAGWVGRFDPTGRLTAATVAHRINDIAVDPAGLVYVATSEYIMRWIPRDRSRFQFPIVGATSLALNSSGLLAWCAPRTPNQTALPGGFKARYEGLHDVFVGTVESSGRVLTATYVPVNGAPLQPEHSLRCNVSLSPSGNIWISSEFSFWSGGRAQTLVALNATGSRVIHSESLPVLPVVSFDDRGNTLVAMFSYSPNLPTLPDAPLRAPCGQAIHLRTLSPAGIVLDATYLREGGAIVEFNGPNRLFATPVAGNKLNIQRIDTSPPAQQGIACLINPAHRRLQQFLAPGALTTIVGTGLGPLETLMSVPDARGQSPTQLAGIQVLANQTPVPVVSVQQGLVTFYLPEGFAGSQVQLQVRTPAGVIDGPSIRSASDSSEFGLFTVDGSGWGPAAALNQDGSVNGPTNPARWGSVFSVFGTGPRPSGFRFFQVEYLGPAPGLAQGVTQVNLRLASGGTSSEWLPIIMPGVFAPRAGVYVAP